MKRFTRSATIFFRRHDRITAWGLLSLALLFAAGFVLTVFGFDALRQIEALGLLSAFLAVSGLLYQVLGDRAKNTEKAKQQGQNQLDNRFREVELLARDLASRLDGRVDVAENSLEILRSQYELQAGAIDKLNEVSTTNRTAIEYFTQQDKIRRDVESIQLQLAGIIGLQDSIHELSQGIEELREQVKRGQEEVVSEQ